MAAALLHSQRGMVYQAAKAAPAAFALAKYSTIHIVSCEDVPSSSPRLHANTRSASTTTRFIPIDIIAPQYRYASSATRVLRKADEGGRGASPTTVELHSLYMEQMNEIKSEREAVFGVSDDAREGDHESSQTAGEAPFSMGKDGVERRSPSSPPEPTPRPPSPLPSSARDAEEEYAEREALFAFSEDERSAWRNNDDAATTRAKSSRDLDRIREVMRGAPPATTDPGEEDAEADASPFSHLTPRGDGASMVDVGGKASSRRVAVARSSVVFPPEVLSAFRVSGRSAEMIGPKGPIFEIARIAGIMGAKRTSDLIPLCHPLPLDRVNVDIRLVDNRAIIECECRVTHRTGVEMEALTGASVAALTIYDMVKAVSHRVEIGRTALVSKSGGKSDFARESDTDRDD